MSSSQDQDVPNHVIIEKPLVNSIPPHLTPRLDPVFVEYYQKYSAGRLATHQIPIAEYRAHPEKYTISYGRELVPGTGVRFADLKCPVEQGEITVRVYESDRRSSQQGPRPVYINFHGGGWVFGGLSVDFDLCKRIVRDLDCVVFDVDYRLSPEYRYPVPVDDCIAAVHWIRSTQKDRYNLDLSRVAVGGCSAGGHLCAVVAQVCRDQGIPLALQILTVPIVDLDVFSPDGSLREDQPYPSYTDLAETQPLPLERMEWFHRQFLGSPRPQHLAREWKVSPIHAPNLKGLAPALVLTAEMDVLRDQGEVYAARMKEAGCEVQIIRFKGAPHTFMQLDAILDSGKQYNAVVLEVLKKAFKL
ncbi:hypothetical protein Z517_03412 [Fonsecaea pedrosoi CBS 271.37]|uniref:Alpha/beta hydrolase fold-3 domain-containing protein n=1 Tax=Fonsecaea pedrosoi CBS 271.37 TaxID=1442368 RepID=A0A0D2GT32_9EURO|nr:uncharacterized protein Z517_03412 [Fonsecaea pedrosoi CBS 271.37]KIW84163.1 hypothetical protein Z517_03412 [Fonsecaea pedrosoi CBS 271.37]